MSRAFHYLCPLVCLLASACQSEPKPLVLDRACVDGVRNSVQYLAGDALEGRGLGTAGLDAAGDYIAGYFRGLKLRPPPGCTSYFQPFSYNTITGVSAQTLLKAGDTIYRTRIDYTPLTISADGPFAGPVVFAGYGIAAKDPATGADYDDYAGVDLAGKVALVMRFEPHDARGRGRFGGETWSSHAALEQKARLAAQRGAVALLIVHPPDYHGPEILPPPVGSAQTTSPIPVVQIRQRVAEDLLRASGAADLRTFQRQIDKYFSPHSFVLGRARIEGAVALDRQSYPLKNVMAWVPGRGRRKNEIIVIGAHYDHIGYSRISRSATTRAVCNGADDNASGTAAMLELARIFGQAGAPARSLLFVAFSGEEQGMLGSRYLLEHPPVSSTRIVAMLNFDMVGRIRGDTLNIGGQGTAAAFPDVLRIAGQNSSLRLRFIWNDGRAPSDSLPFLQRQIPVLFFWSGMHEDLHRPSDDADKINYAGESEAINIAAGVIADLIRRPDLRYTPPTTQPTSRPSSQPASRPTSPSASVN